MNKLAEELRGLNGKKHDSSYYMAWVWDDLKQYWPDKFNYATLGFTKDDIDKFVRNFNTWICSLA